MTFRVRSYVGQQALPAMDVTTDSPIMAARELSARAMAYKGWDDVAVLEDGDAARRGIEAARWASGVLRRAREVANGS